MTALVLDCSIAAAWLFVDEADPETDHLLARIKDGARWYPTSGILKPAIYCYKPKKKGALPRLRLTSVSPAGAVSAGRAPEHSRQHAARQQALKKDKQTVHNDSEIFSR